MSSSMEWEMWTSQIWRRQRTQRMKMFRAFSTLMAPEKAWASIVITDGKYLQQHHNNPAGSGYMCLIRSLRSFQPEQHQEEYLYYHQYLEMSRWQQFSRQYVMLKSSSICFTSLHQSEDKASCPWLIKHPILADLQSFLSSCISLFEQLSWKLQHSPDQRPLYCKLLPRRLWPITNIVSGWHFSCTINKVLRNN